METIEHILDTIEQSDFMASIDLADAFFSVPIHESCKKFLCFEFNNQRYCFNVLPFGMSSSPRIFSKVLRPVIIYLRSQGIKILSYLDDIFLCASSRETLILNIKSTLNILVSLGYYPNYEKSCLVPSQSMLHLGFKFDTIAMKISVPEDKIQKSRSSAQSLLATKPSLRSLSAFIGLTVSLKDAFPLAPCFYRDLQYLQGRYVKANVSWDSAVTLDQPSVDNLLWWKDCEDSLPPANIKSSEPSITLFTDASKVGWGGSLSTGETVSAFWSDHESQYHINLLELTAIYFCLRSFISHLKNKSVSIFSDNLTCVYYVNKCGGTHSKYLCDLAIKIRLFLFHNDIETKVFHVAGTQNTIADNCSRQTPSRHEYSITLDCFVSILSMINFSPTIDLFASRLTAKLSYYVSQFYDPFSTKINAFTFPWPNNVYLFPPINLISKVVNKLISDNVHNALLITPAWPGLLSLPTILNLLIDSPIFIPSVHLEGCLPIRHSLTLMAWPISTREQETKAYLKILQDASLKASPNLQSVHIKDTGNNLVTSLIERGHKVKFV